MEKRQSRVYDLTMMAVVAALYVVLTLLIAPFAYGSIQLRISEGLNHLAVFNKRYIVAISIGVFIANTQSSLGVIDMVFGTLGTVVMLSLSYYLTRHVQSVIKRLAISTVVDTLMMWAVALELHIFASAPFWITFGTVALGEFITLVLGAIVVYFINKRVDLSA
ncbi:putative membrane protein [Weissella uvarum]|uniref:QueT transporter family protein n=1 Tax=Weissella uvarum TaxID=1479233 RepID=UPI0019600E29|nr:QueT transporter family protein [Weissella uvarum]MBM7617035.1 putative membrane protein [Weissella uvarum]MCM0595333.1 QueT transporter family protein [Weissella uvarum]